MIKKAFSNFLSGEFLKGSNKLNLKNFNLDKIVKINLKFELMEIFCNFFIKKP